MKSFIVLLILILVGCSKSPAEMNNAELLEAKLEGKITSEQYTIFKALKDQQQIDDAKDLMEKWSKLASDTNLTKKQQIEYKKEADYWRRFHKHLLLKDDEQIQFGLDSLFN